MFITAKNVKVYIFVLHCSNCYNQIKNKRKLLLFVKIYVKLLFYNNE